eukprot:scaffold20180_cov28-Tisochrysis_lutea.AAC.5
MGHKGETGQQQGCNAMRSRCSWSACSARPEFAVAGTRDLVLMEGNVNSLACYSRWGGEEPPQLA